MPTSSARDSRETVLLTVSLVGVVLGVVFVAVMQLGQGHFAYSLDDPYIHLALSKHLRHMQYGLNTGEAASPSSSILWPFLLTPFAGTSLHEYMPLAYNVVAAVVLALVLVRLLRTLTDGAALTKPIPTALGVVVTLLFTNVVTSVFTGMEHVAHAAATAAVTVGLIVVHRGERPPWWLIAGIVVGPSIRYEGVVVTAAAVVVLFVWGHRRLAITCALAGAAPVVAFSAWSLTRGLSPLPSSVLVKSTTGGPFGALGETLLRFPHIPILALSVVVIAADALIRGRRGLTALHVFALVVMLTQATNHDWGSLSRYLTYTFFTGLPVLAYLHRDRVIAAYASTRTTTHVLSLALVLAVVGCNFANFAFLTPQAARNIELQQAQMARFVADYWKRPVAVNDLGEVSYRSDHYVLDLWGLGNEDARKEREADDGVAWMDTLTRGHHVGLAMIYRYPDWFRRVPPQWTRVGELVFDVPVITASHERVSFYATTPNDIHTLRRVLERFARTLPPGARFRLS